MLAVLAAGFIYINSTSVNTNQILAMEPSPDKNGCIVHLLSKNPFKAEESCVEVQKKIDYSNKSLQKDNTADLLLTGLVGILFGGIGGFLGGRASSKPEAVINKQII